MASSIRVTNLAEVLAGFDATENQIEIAAQYAIVITGLAVERQAKKNASTGTRSYVKRISRNGNPWLKTTPPKHISGGGEGPNVVTGNLRRSITTTAKYGFGMYIAEVGASMVYARQVEQGGGNWKSGVKYPYLSPAAEKLSHDGTLTRTFTKAFASKIRG
jgi:hypothetical protein